MGILRGGKKPDRDGEFGREIVGTEIARGESVGDDYDRALRNSYMILDLNLINQMLKDPDLKPLYPAFSFVNRTSKVGDREREILWLDYDYLFLLRKLSITKESYDFDKWIALEALRLSVPYFLSDAQGWKGRLLTEQIKIIRAQVEKKKRGWL